MGQEPNLPLGIEDLPRARPRPGAARRWSPGRPGELTAPDQVPDDGFSAVGPDTGYVYRLLRHHPVTLEGVSDADATAAVAALAGARASFSGRAPVRDDLEAARDVLAGEPAEELDGVARSHGRARALVARLADRVRADR